MKINTLILFSCLSLTFEASAGTLDCPKTIKTNQSIQGKIDNWDAFDSNAPHNLSLVTFYSKHPKELASLAPDSSKNNQSIWNFNEDEIWMACEYLNTSIQLIQKLPKSTKKCTATYNPNYSSISRVNCQ